MCTPLSLQAHFSSYSYPLFFEVTATSYFPSRFLSTTSNHNTSQSLLTLSPKFLLKPSSNCSNKDYSVLDIDDDDGYVFVDEGQETLSGDGVFVEMKKLGSNSRRIRSKIKINASLEAVWNILTDYEKLVDYIPGLAVSELVEKKDNFARLYQIGQQNLPFGLKFNAKGVLDCYEKDLEITPLGKKRDIEFRMIEGDFQCFEGKWSIEQFNRGNCNESVSSSPQITLSYLVDVKPKLWLPVRLVEGRLCNEIKNNLSCIREAALKAINKALHSH